MRTYDPAQALVALHIPKTGGTSILQVLQAWFPGDRLQFHYRQLGALPPRHVLGAGQCVYGHFNAARGFGVQDYYPQAEQFIAFFREPFDRFVSQWFFLNQLHRSGTPVAALADNPDFETWLRRRAEEQAQGRNSHSFVWQLPRPPGAEPMAEMLQNRFVFVGTMERCAESVACLARLLDRPPVEVPFLNATARDAADFGQWRSRFERDFADEMGWYAEACRINASQIEQWRHTHPDR
jgi:hypothetical protein